MIGWQETTLGAVTEWMSGGTPNKSVPSYWGGNIPWISANSMNGSRYDSSNLMITKEGLQSGSRLASKGTILLLVRGGALHNKIPVGIAMRDVAFNQDVKAILPKDGIDPWFLYAWFCAKKTFLLSDVVELTGIGAGKLDTDRMQKLKFLLPPIKEQEAIAHVAKALDDKIELNSRMNATLEAAARALFKSWFVDFDPVKAKMTDNAPFGMDAATAALFPARLTASEFGDIPKGWTVSSLNKIVSVTKGVSYKSEELQPSDNALVTLKSFGRGGGYRLDGLKPYKGSYKPEQEIKPGEIVIAFTDVTQAAEVIGRAALVIRDDRFNKLVASLDTGIIRPINPDLYSNAFLYFLMGQPLFVDHMLSYTSGTTVLHLSKNAIPSYKATLPTQKISEAFSIIAEPLMQKIARTSEENKSLERTRDYLLPRLISGEIRIPDAEKFVEVLV